MSESAPLLHEKPKSSIAWSYFQLTRLHKFPAGSNLVFWPGGEWSQNVHLSVPNIIVAWGVALSACRVGMPIEQVLTQIGMYLVGSTLRHSAACVWNDICDREFDRQVGEITRNCVAVYLLSLTMSLQNAQNRDLSRPVLYRFVVP